MDDMYNYSVDDIGSRTGLCMPGNRPVCCSNVTGRVIAKTYDHMGRMAGRVESQDSIVLSHERYLYRGYLRIAALDMLNNAALIHAAVWDPTEPAATRPLLLQTPSGWFTYSFDQAKNVTELFDSAGGIAAAYDHGPFGEDMAATGPAAGLNPFRFSSEVWDGALGLVCYTFRPYNPLDGRFLSRDPIEERDGLNLYGFVGNDPVNRWDALGLAFVEHLGADAVKLSPRIMPADYFTGPKLKNKDGNLPKLGEVWGYVTYSDKTLDCTCERKVGNRAAGTKTCYKMVCKVKWTAQIYLNEIIQGDAKKLMGTFGHEQRHVKAVWDNVESQIVGKLEEEDGVFDQKGPCDDACKKHKVVFLPILLDLADHTKERHGIDGHPNDGQLYDPLEGSVWKGPAHRK